MPMRNEEDSLALVLASPISSPTHTPSSPIHSSSFAFRPPSSPIHHSSPSSSSFALRSFSSPFRSSSQISSEFLRGPALIEACHNNNSDALLELITAGGDVNFKDTNQNVTPLYSACLLGHSACVNLLLAHGGDVNALCGKNNDQTPLLASIKSNNPDYTRILLERGASPTPSWESLVEEAILADRAGCLDVLLEHGAKVDCVNKFGGTPLHSAASYGKPACIEVLLNYGASLDATDMNNMTPYDIAVEKGHRWAKMLLKNGDTSMSSSLNSQADYLSQSLSQNVAEDEKALNLSTIMYHDISTVPVTSHDSSPSLSFSLSMESSQPSQYSQQSQLGSQDLNPIHPPRYVRPNFEIDLLDLEILEEIGSGFYGKVFKGIWQSGTPVAVKQLTSTDGKIGELTRKNFRLEMEMLMALRHPNIVLFLGVSLQSPTLYLVMEYMSRGSLSHVLHKGASGKNLGMKARIRMALDVACGMNYLHKQMPEPILHRDLKSSNLLVTEDLRIKVSDFGLARVKDGGFRIRNPLDITIQAPEVLRSKPTRYTEKSDIYSYGLLLWELMAVQPVFESKEPKKIAADVLKNIRPPIPSSCPEPLGSLMARCWDEDPMVRPTFQEIVQELRPLGNLDADNSRR